MTSNNLQCEMGFHAEANSLTKWKVQLAFSGWSFCITCVHGHPQGRGNGHLSPPGNCD